MIWLPICVALQCGGPITSVEWRQADHRPALAILKASDEELWRKLEPQSRPMQAEFRSDGTGYSLAGSVAFGIFVKSERAGHAQRILRTLPHTQLLNFTQPDQKHGQFGVFTHGRRMISIAFFDPMNTTDISKEVVHALRNDGTALLISGTDSVGFTVEVDPNRAAHAQRLLRKLPHAAKLRFQRLNYGHPDADMGHRIRFPMPPQPRRGRTLVALRNRQGSAC